MNVLTILLISASLLMLFCTVVCGLWLRSKGINPEGVAFHLKLAIPTVILTLASFAILVVRVWKG